MQETHRAREMIHMASRALVSSLVVVGTASGCGGLTGPDCTVAWRLEIVSQSSFGVRIWLDGEAVYTQTAPATQRHQVDVQRPYRAGEHLLEFEILAANSNPGTYTAAWTVQVKPSGSSFTADGVPTALSVGERLTIRVPL